MVKMKKIIFFFALLFTMYTINAQSTAYPRNESGAKVFHYTATAADTLNGSTGRYITWEPGFNKMYLPTVQVGIHELNGSATAYVLIEGSNDNVTYYLLDSCTTTLVSGTEGVSAEANTLIYQDLSTGVSWNYLRARAVLSTTGRWHFDMLDFRAVGKND